MWSDGGDAVVPSNRAWLPPLSLPHMRQQSTDRVGVLVDVILSETHYLKVAKAVTTDGHDTSRIVPRGVV